MCWNLLPCKYLLSWLTLHVDAALVAANSLSNAYDWSPVYLLWSEWDKNWWTSFTGYCHCRHKEEGKCHVKIWWCWEGLRRELQKMLLLIWRKQKLRSLYRIVLNLEPKHSWYVLELLLLLLAYYLGFDWIFIWDVAGLLLLLTIYYWGFDWIFTLLIFIFHPNIFEIEVIIIYIVSRNKVMIDQIIFTETTFLDQICCTTWKELQIDSIKHLSSEQKLIH